MAKFKTYSVGICGLLLANKAITDPELSEKGGKKQNISRACDSHLFYDNSLRVGGGGVARYCKVPMLDFELCL